MELRLALISVLVTTALSGPVKNLSSNTKCAVQCTNKNKFSYRAGTVYEYSYEAETKTGIQGTTDEQGGLKVVATAEIEVLSKCEFLLTVKNSDILGTDPDYPRQYKQHPQHSQFQKELESESLRFSFQDGIIEEVCPDDSESDWSINFKRGILSAFQNSMESLEMETEVTEIDVAGKCPTTYRIIQEGWRTVKIKKTKDLVKCNNRHGFQTSAQATIYSIPSSVQSLPLLKSTQECDQILSTEGRVEKTVCHEIHLFRPFAKDKNGAMTEVTQTLKFVTEKRGGQIIQDAITRRETLLYHHHHDHDVHGTSNKEAAISKLTELCTSTKDGIQPETPKLFSQLVQILKTLSADDLTEVYEQSQMESFCVDNADRVRKFYNDAVPMIGTTAAVKQIAKLIMNNEITGRIAEIWLSSLSLIQDPSKEMLAEISKLMDLPEGEKVYLPASVMINTFCKENQNCENIAEVENIVTKLQNVVGSSCIVTEGNYIQVLTGLRAIGNLEIADQMVPTVVECIAKKTNDMEIRVSAVESFRRMSCGADRNNLMILFRDNSEDSELRIAAYIQLMKCPNENILTQVKDTLASEVVNQVGSFVWTHLTNLMESSTVYKQSVQSILEDEVLKKEFDLDKRKFSRNYEWSYFSERMNAGAGLESNIVWSQKSFVPRSAMVNLTVDLFGRSVNLFELGGRVEGLEKILVENFGPKGYFGGKQSPTPEDKLSRDVDFNKIERISEKFGKTEDEFRGSLFMRVFGNEISYYNTKQSQDNTISSQNFNFLEMFMSLAKEQEISKKMSQTFIDSSIITPTVAGLPLYLKVIATSTIDLNAKGKMDLRSPAKNIILEASFSPSGAVEVSSMMHVDGFVTKSGLKMTSNLYSSTAVRAKFELDQKQELTMEFEIPKEKSEILNFKSELYIVHADHEKEQLNNNNVVKKSCSGATIARVTGVEFCFDMSIPEENKENTPHFPLTGPSKFSLIVLKRDTHSSYKFEWKNIMNKKKSVFMMMYNTPGSKVMRKTGFNVEIDHQDSNMVIDMISPWKTAKFEGSLLDKTKRKKVVGTFTVDSTNIYRAEALVDITERKSIKTYKPQFEILRPNKDPILLAGEIVYKQGKVLTTKLVLTGAMEKPASLDLTVRFTKTQYGMTASILHSKDQKYSADINLDINDRPKKTTYSPRIIISIPNKKFVNFYGSVNLINIKGKNMVKYDMVLGNLFKQQVILKGESSVFVKGKRNIYKGKVYFNGPQRITTRIRYQFDKKLRVTTTSVKLDYNFQNWFKKWKDVVQFNSKLQKKNVKKQQRISIYSNIKSARFADYNNQANLVIDHRPNSKIDADLTFDYGKNYMDKSNKYRMSVFTTAKYNIKEKAGNINYNITFKLPAEKLDSHLSGSHKYTNKELKSDFHIRYDNKKAADISIDLMDLSTKHFKYRGDVALKYAGRHVQVSGQAVEKADEYSTKWRIQHQEGHTSLFDAAYSWPSKEKREIDSSIRIDQQPPVAVSGSITTDIMKPEGNLKVKVGDDFYVLSGNGEYDGEAYIKGLGKVAYPTRQIIVETEGGLKRDTYSGKVDVNWDARDHEENSRVIVEGSFRNNTIEDFAVSASIKYPSRTLSASIEHFSKDKLDTSVSIGWDKNEVISARLKFDKDIRKYKQNIEGSVSFTTPFKFIKEFQIGGNHAKNKNKIEYGGTFTWNEGKTVALQYESKLPLDISDLEMKLDLKTPSKYGNPSVNIRNTFSKDFIHQEGLVKITWGTGHYFTVETNGETQFKGSTRKVQRNVAVLTSFDEFKTTTLNFTHEDDLKKFLSKAVYVKDGIKYLYILDMDHAFDEWSIENSGTFDISSPRDSLKIIWSHKNKDKELETVVNTDWGRGQKFSAKLTGSMESFPNRNYKANLEMKIPSSEFSSLIVGLEHEDNTGYIKSVGKVIANRENMGTVQLDYARQLGSTDFGFRITSKYMKDFIIDGKTRHAHLPMTGSLKIEWNPLKRIFLDGSLHYDSIGTMDSKAVLTTPFEKAKKIIMTASHKMDRLDWVAETEVEFAPMQKVKAEVRYNSGLNKLVRLQITTPFPTFRKLNTGAYLKFITYPDQWQNEIDFEILPLVKKLSAVTTWQYNTQTRGTFRLDTPFEKVPYISAEVQSEKVSGKRKSMLILEYLPTQKIEMSAEYTLKNGKELDGSVSLKTPFNEEIFALYRQEDYARDQLKGFQRRVELKYSRTQNIIIDTTFGTSPKIFGSVEVKMPVRGYETVKLSFGHKGTEWNNFQTTVDYETNGKKIEIEALFDIVNDIKGKLMLKSPFESMQIAQIDYSHMGTPFDFKTHGGFTFNKYKVESDALFTHNEKQTLGSLNFKSPWKNAEDILVSFNKDGTWKKFTFSGEAGYESGSKYIVAIKHDLRGKDASTDIVIQNPLTEDIIIKLTYDNRKKGFTTIVQGSVGTENSVLMETTYKLKNYDLDLQVDLTTVITGEKHVSSFIFEHKGELGDFSCMAELKSSYSELDEKIKLSVKGTQTIYDIDANLEVIDTWKPISFVAGYKSEKKDDQIVTVAKYNDNLIKSEISLTDSKYRGKLNAVTKVEGYENFELDFDHTNSKHKATNILTIKPFNEKSIKLESDIMFKGITWFDVDMKFTSGIGGFENVESKITHIGNFRDFTSNIIFKKPNMSPLELKANLNSLILSRIDGSFKFTSGIQGAETIDGSLKHRGDMDDLSTEVIVTIQDRTPIKLDLEFKKQDTNIKGKAHFTSDISEFENLEVELDQQFSKNDFMQKFQITSPYTLTQTVTFKNMDDLDFSYKFISNIEGYENIQMALVHKGEPTEFVNTISVAAPFTKAMKIVTTTNINRDLSKVIGSVYFTSEWEGAEDIHFTLSHTGTPTDFNNKITLRPPFMDEIQLSSSMKFEEESSFQMNVDFSSKIAGAETLGFSTVNKLVGGNGGTSQTEIKLDKLRKIVIDVEGKMKLEIDREMSFKFDMITPFKRVETVNVEYSDESKSKDQSEIATRNVLTISHNGKKYWDTVASGVMIGGKSYVYNFNMEEPAQVEYGYNIQVEEPYSVDLHVNWNKMEPNSNFKLQSKLENMSDLKIKAIHPSRTVIVEGAWIDEQEKVAKLIVTWDQDKNQAVGVETKWQTKRQELDMTDSSLKVVTPWRSVEVLGSVDKVLARKSAGLTVFWDSEKDRSRKVSIQSEMTPDNNGYTGRMQITSPIIGKDLTVTRQFTKNEGQTLYETRTEFSYSDDPTKAVILTTKLEDLSETGSTNHSYTFGLAQAFTRLDTSVTMHLGRSSSRDSVGMLVKYQTSELQRKNILLMAEIDKLHKKIIFLNVGPRKSAGIMGQMQGDSPVSVSVRGLHELEDVIEADIIIDSKKKAVELQMKYDKAHPKNMLHFAAKYPSKTNLEVQVYRTGDRPQITDSVIKIDLKTTRILHSKINWRPDMLTDLTQYGVKVIEDFGKFASDEFTTSANEMERELNAKYTAISGELERELLPFIESISEQLNHVQTRLNKLKNHLNKMYDNNDMYVKDAAESFKQKSSTVVKMYKNAVVQMKDAVKDIRQKLEEFKDMKNYPFDKKYRELVNYITSEIQTCKETMVETVKKEMETITKRMKQHVDELRKDLEKTTDKIRTKLTGVLNNVFEHAEVKELMSYIDDVLKHLPEPSNLPSIDWKFYLNKIHTVIKQKLATIDLEKLYNDVIENTKSAVAEQLKPVMQDEKVQELKEMVDQLQKKVTWAYQQWNIDKALKSYLIELYNDLQTYVKEDIAALKFLHWDKNRIIAFDPENGNIEFEIYLPTPADTLESLPKFSVHKYVQKLDSMIKKIDQIELPRVFDFSFWDLYYKYKPSWNPKDWVPPFNSFALVVGSQHFITFDQKHIDFAGRCSYILVKDMVDNKFTVILNYVGKRRAEIKSLEVLAEGRSIEIFSDFTVKIDNTPTDLPMRYEKLSVLRDGNLIQIDTGRGLIISCDMASQHLAFFLSGWYFGKVDGILGSYNNEQYDDMMDRNGQVTSDIGEMAQTWEVASRCRNNANIATTVKVEEGQRGYVKCSKLFVDSDSPLRPCYKIVDPSYFMKVCMVEMQTSKGDGCSAVSAYVRQCRQNNIMLWAPKMCITCSSPNNELFEGGETIKLSPSSDDFKVPKSADVVMVVEQTSCNSNPANHLGDLVDKIEQAFLKNDITNNRYGLIGFGGTPRPLFGRKSASVTHTFEGKLFSESSNFAKGKEALKFSYHFTDPLEAIMTGADMPFRVGVSKTIVLFLCGDCSDSKSVNYNHLKHVLFTRDITLHIIRDQDIRLEGNRSPKDLIMGFDARKKYTMKPLKEMSSNDIHIPEDTCTSLSLKTDGSIFHTAGLIDTKLRNRKWFLDTVSQRISETAPPNECQVCQCVADHTGMAKSVCRKCYSSISDYLPNWWNSFKHPTMIQDEMEKQYKEFFGDDTWKVFDQ